jgi:O-acetyl-ADP-ribose deacetylase (regulator of RNase III)
MSASATSLAAVADGLRELRQPATIQANNYTTTSTTTLVRIARGTILAYSGAAIVNAANEGCVTGFGVDEAINRAAGDYDIKQARRELNGCDTGCAKSTGAFQHDKVQHIIHAVGPVYRYRFGVQHGTPAAEEWLESRDALLAIAYRAALLEAERLGAETVGFSLLSAGVFRGEKPLLDVLRIACESIAQFDAYEKCRDVTLVAYTADEERELCNAFDAVFGGTT